MKLNLIISVFLFIACSNAYQKDSEQIIHDDESLVLNEAVVKIEHEGPRGGFYVNTVGEKFRYVVFASQFSNDGQRTLKLNIGFPDSPVKLEPDTSLKVEVILVPEGFTPDRKKDSLNFGLHLEDYFELAERENAKKELILSPNESKTIYSLVLFGSNFESGISRSKLFVEGQDHDGPFYQVRSSQIYSLKEAEASFMFGFSFDPPNNHVLIPCGTISLD